MQKILIIEPITIRVCDKVNADHVDRSNLDAKYILLRIKLHLSLRPLTLHLLVFNF